tara:strand:+ start:194 stop:439 length:246 start_codon:yes stop_codon:yes gene_type:complete
MEERVAYQVFQQSLRMVEAEVVMDVQHRMLSLPQAEGAEVPLAVQEQEILPQLLHPKELVVQLARVLQEEVKVVAAVEVLP